MSDAANESLAVMANAPKSRQSNVRAVRNNNPGNIERGTKWIGLMDPAKMTPDQRAENRFAVFAHPKYGFRAMATVILTYARKRRARDGSAIDTIGDVIARWAPPVENNTAGYAKRVAEAVGVKPDALVDLESFAVLFPMLKAMSIVEAGGWHFSEPDLEAGLKLAGILRKAPSPGTKREGAVVAVAAGAATTGSVIEIVKSTSDAVAVASPAIDTWKGLYAAVPTIALIIVAVAVAFLAYRYIRRVRRDAA